MCPAIHTISRILLRPSSTYEPSDPPLRIFQMFSYWQLYKSISPTPLCDKNTQLLALARKQFQISSSHANIALASQLCSPTHKCASKTNNDPSAGSPTETLLRLLLPLNDQVWSSSKYARQLLPVDKLSVRLSHWTIQSVVATGGVYKGQGRNQRKLMTCAYWEFLVQGKQLQFPIPSTSRVQRITSTFRPRI